MYLLVETVRTEDGKLLNTAFHNERLIRSLYSLFGLTKEVDLGKIINIPSFAHKGVFKCRVEYDREIRKIEFIPYSIRPVKSLKLIEDNEIEYGYKFVDRTAFDRLLAGRAGCDDILIIKNGMVTDASYANVVFRNSDGSWVTPSTFLLPGTRRASLLSQGLITEAKITYKDIIKYSEVRLINAMVGLEDTEGIPISNIIWQ